MKHVDIFTDGACQGNPGPGGWGAILRFNGIDKEFSGGEPNTTNNRMELTAVIKTLLLLKEPCDVTLYSDSQYVCNAIKLGWAKKWQKNGWMRNKKDPALNPDLWSELLSLANIHTINVVWVKGHDGHEENERCDSLAVAAAEKYSKQQIFTEGELMIKHIYADNAATTPLSPKVLEDMMPYLTTIYGNPSSPYSIGNEAEKAIVKAREEVANILGAKPKEIFFTSGGSESDNWAIKGIAYNMAKKGKKHIITSTFEHHAVLHSLDALKKDGFEITYLDVHSDGLVRPKELEKAIRNDTGLVTIMYANNEIGTIQPIKELGDICKKHNVVFHTDAVQAIGNVPINVIEDNIDLLSLTAHKFHGPKGCGALYIKSGINVQTLIDGGAQERGKRAGTENVSGIVGLASALKFAVLTMEERKEKLTKMRNRLIDGLSVIEHSKLNGDKENRLPGNFNMSFEGVEGEALLLRLDLKGICASSGSACTSGSLDPSHVLLAIGLTHQVAHGSLRISLSDENTEEDIDYILEVVPQVVELLRSMSPLWEKIKKEEKNK